MIIVILIKLASFIKLTNGVGLTSKRFFSTTYYVLRTTRSKNMRVGNLALVAATFATISIIAHFVALIGVGI